jgi:signal transduction histidine kinase
VLGLSDGVPEGNSGFPNVWIDPQSDRLWAATTDGVVTLDLKSFPGDTAAPRLRVDDVRIDGRSVATEGAITVPPGANALEIRFTAPSFTGRDGVLFRYRLRGHDRDWIESGTTRVARYAKLEPGSYWFDLVGRTRDGVERAEPVSLRVTVVPAWFQTTAARLVFLLAGLGALWSAFQWLTRRLRRRARVLQREIEVREEAEQRAAAAARDLAHVSRLATAGELATSIAHELNQPLAAVVGSAQTARRLLNGQGDARLEPLLDTIVAQSDRAAGVIRTLRAFVAKHRSADAMVPPDQVVEETLRLLQHEMTSRRVVVRVVDDLWLRPGLVPGDPVQLQQVLANLLLNAADAMSTVPESQRLVTVELRQVENDMVQISVADEGEGLTPEVRERIFEPFFTTKKSGLGMGLSISRSIVEAHAGRLWAARNTDRGTTFAFSLPVAAEASERR